MLKISTSKAIYFSLIISICFSCTDLLSDEDTPINITDEFHIDMFQSLDQTDFELILELSTSEHFDCTNYKISTVQFNNNNILELAFSNILEPEVCQEGSAPASVQIKFLEQDINQKIRFFFTDQIYDEADLSMDDSTIDMDIKSNNGIKFYDKQLTKIPAYTLTCLFEYNDLNNELIIQEKLDVLTPILNSSKLNDGHYGYFNVEGNRINAKDNSYTYSQGAHFDLTSLGENDLQNFENQLIEIQESLSGDDLKLELIRTY